MKSEKLYRYPGVKPFTEDEQHIFFGRKTDADKLFKLVSLEKLVLLYAKSGLGKSSLLNAGVVPRFKKETDFIPINIRFGARTEQSISPVENILSKLPKAQKNNILEKLNYKDETLWLKMKELQMPDTEENNSYILFFDQFEELFTYTEKEISEFKKQLSDMLYAKIPAYLRKNVSAKLKQNEKFYSDKELEYLYKQLEIKVLFSIRSDRMSLLNKLTDFLPDVLKNYYELGSLDKKSAIEAITKPAEQINENFISPVFAYSTNAISEIFEYLTKNGENEIETFQLQTICQFAENLIIDNEIKANIETKELEVKTKNLGNLKNVFRNHYDNLISKITDPKKQIAARKLIEDKLIIDGNRVSLPDVVVLKENNIDKKLIAYLHDVHHLIRSEPNTVGDISYEISHDTLIAPILDARELRIKNEKLRIEKEKEREELRLKNEELRIKKEKQKEKLRIEKNERERKRKQQRTIIIIVSIAAVVSIIFGIFGFVNMLEAKKSEKKAQKLLKQNNLRDAQHYFDDEKFEIALGKYFYLRDTLGFDIKGIEKRIDSCYVLDSISKLFYQNMILADSLIQKKDFENIKIAYEYFNKAKKLNYPFADKSFDKFYIKFEQTRENLEVQANALAEAGGKGEKIAREINEFLKELK